MSGLLLSGVSTDSRTGSPCYLKHARLSVSEISKPAAGKYFYLLLLTPYNKYSNAGFIFAFDWRRDTRGERRSHEMMTFKCRNLAIASDIIPFTAVVAATGTGTALILRRKEKHLNGSD
jgi:hypothetical protein